MITPFHTLCHVTCLIQDELAELEGQKKVSLIEFATVPFLRRAIFVSVVLHLTQQLGGINGVRDVFLLMMTITTFVCVYEVLSLSTLYHTMLTVVVLVMTLYQPCFLFCMFTLTTPYHPLLTVVVLVMTLYQPRFLSRSCTTATTYSKQLASSIPTLPQSFPWDWCWWWSPS